MLHNISRMIATLEGTISEKIADTVVLDVHGVGYGLLVPAEDFGVLASGKPAKLYVYEHIREAAYDLYGFSKLQTKTFFEQLLSVNGVGPKMALNMLSIGSADQVRAAIANGDVKFLQQASGVGKRVAERAVVELKDKVGLDGSLGDAVLHRASATDEAVHALTALGYTNDDAARALANIPKDLSTEERVKLALKGGA